MKRYVLLLLTLAIGCEPSGPDASPDVVRTTLGDTTLVRTLRGSVWPSGAVWRSVLSIGELDGPPERSFGRLVSLAVHPDGRILTVDRQVPAVRVFDSGGDYLDTWGTRGEGPGELESPDAGLAVLADGRVVVRDRGNARMQIYGPEGTHSATWPVITGQYINRRAIGITGDTLLNPDLVNPTDPLPEWRLGLIRLDADGAVIDTLAIPDNGVSAHRFVVRVGGNTVEQDLPFAAAQHWAWHPDGFIVHGSGDRYAVTLDRPSGPLRLERAVEPTPVTDAERTQEEERVTKAIRWLDPSWRWDGPAIPESKPFLSGLLTGMDGRIWVLRDGPAYEIDDPDYDPADPFDTEIRWQQDVVADAFEQDGTFLGSVTMPRDIDERVPPIFKGDTLWAVVRDGFGVQRIHRFELAFAEGG